MRMLLHTLGSIAVKLLILVVLTNLLFYHSQGQSCTWSELLCLDALPDKLVIAGRMAWTLLREAAHPWI